MRIITCDTVWPVVLRSHKPDRLGATGLTGVSVLAHCNECHKWSE